MKKNILKKRKVLVSSLIFLIIGLGIFVYYDYSAKGATYGWVQTTWTSETSNTALHASNQTGWAEYSAKDANASTGESVSVSLDTIAVTHTDTADFDTGSGSGILTTGDALSLDLP